MFGFIERIFHDPGQATTWPKFHVQNCKKMFGTELYRVKILYIMFVCDAPLAFKCTPLLAS